MNSKLYNFIFFFKDPIKKKMKLNRSILSDIYSFKMKYKKRVDFGDYSLVMLLGNWIIYFLFNQKVFWEIDIGKVNSKLRNFIFF